MSNVRPRTFASYSQIVRDHLLPTLRSAPLTRLQPVQLQRLYAQLLDQGKSPKTVANIHRVMHRALNHAQRWRLVTANVADLVDPPRQRRPEMKALSPEQARQALDAAHGDDLEALWTVALTTGLRQGELLALRWPDVDLERGSLRVVASLIRIVGQEPQLVEPKSRRSRRQVEPSAAAVDALRRHRSMLPPSASSFLALTADRYRSRPRGSAGDDCSTVAITLDVYSHVTPAMHREAAKVMDDLLG